MSGGSEEKTKKAEKSRKPWGGRFSEATNPAVERFSASIHFDRALARHDIRGSKAQARMLGSTGLISNDDALALVGGLDRIAKEIEDGSFPLRPGLRRHPHEHRGPAARPPRPRGGQVAYRSLPKRSGRDRHGPLPAGDGDRDRTRAPRTAGGCSSNALAKTSTPSSPAIPICSVPNPCGSRNQWLAHIETLGRDASRFRDGRARITRSPLGAGAMAGSTLPLDRAHTARELGFDAPTRNSMDTVASRDSSLEYLANAAITMVHLSRLAEELVLWSSAEFGFIELADAYSTGSSLMPQKKKPGCPRTRSGKIRARDRQPRHAADGAQGGSRSPTTGTSRRTKEPVFDSVRTLLESLEVMSGAIATLDVRRDRMAEAAADPMLLATDLAEILVRAGVPFRDAHEVVGRIVGHCTRENVDLRALTHAEMQGFHSAFEAGADELLELERSLESRVLTGWDIARSGRGCARRGRVRARRRAQRHRGRRGQRGGRRMSPSIARRGVAMLTILAIAGTLTACGRYGRPVRPEPVGETGAAVESREEADGPAAIRSMDRASDRVDP